MNYCADLHIHSYYSRATSKQLNLEHLTKWGQIKGLQVIATGDITHPKWLAEMREKLVESEQGFYTLKEEYRKTTQNEVPGSCNSDVFFILSGEVSTIYKKNDKVRKVHSVVFMPSLDAVEKFQTRLDRIGNIHSDGRPILGLDTRDLLEITLETDDNAQFIPAHIWTPWFSLFGSKSGFDTIEECFEDLTPHIFALETGLSSDPPMNWRLSMLDPYVLVSNSDAHSPAKLAREANLFQTDLNYNALFHALKNRDSDDFWGTIEFFPEEGKYHMDGHRKCNSRTKPAETMANKGLCPVCGKPAVLGVSYRVEELADREEGFRPESAKPFKSLIPLPEVLGEVVGVGPNSKRVQELYFNVLKNLGSELDILMNLPISDIQSEAGALIAEAIKRMRNGDIHPVPGYDGEYGIIKVFQEGEKEKLAQQDTLFALPEINKAEKKSTVEKTAPIETVTKVKEAPADYGLNDEQQQAVDFRGSLIIKAGPGTGKTRTLTQRLAALINMGDATPEDILAITFTSKAAEEMRERIEKLVGSDVAGRMTIQTFHAFGAAFLRKQEYFFDRDWDFRIVSVADDAAFLDDLKNRCGEKISNTTLERISFLKSQGYTPDLVPKDIWESSPSNLKNIFEQYEQLLIDENAVDFDDLINLTVRLLSQNPELRREITQRYPVISVDEFQDINKMQYELFRLFAIPARDVCVIGDPDQAIYGFRGASAEYFNQFLKDFPKAEFIQLKRNYRSAQNILSASLQMLRRGNEGKAPLWSNLDPDVKVHINVSPTDRAEAEFVVHRIEQHVGGTTFFSLDSQRIDERGLPQDFSFSDFAILLRSRRLAPPLIEALTRSGIPFQNIDDSTLVNQPFMNLVNAALTAKIRQNPDLINTPATLYFDDRDVSSFLHEFYALPDDSDIATILGWLEKFVPTDNAETKRWLKKLADRSAFFSNTDHFIDALMLQRQIDNFETRADRVHLLTMHAAKGLEFPVVFIVGCEDGVIPHYIPGQKLDAEEERRLLYVGMTRAQRYLYLTRAKQRLLFGQKRAQEPSRFLNSISETLLHSDQQQLKKKKNNQLSLF